MTENIVKLLIFRVGSVRCCVDALLIQSIFAASDLYNEDGSSRVSRNIFKHAGILASFIDLRTRFGLPASDQLETGKVILAPVERGMMGFWVDDVVSIVEPSEGRWGEAPAYIPGDIFTATFIYQEQIILFSDFQRMFDMQDVEGISSHFDSMLIPGEVGVPSSDGSEINTADSEQTDLNINSTSETLNVGEIDATSIDILNESSELGALQEVAGPDVDGIALDLSLLSDDGQDLERLDDLELIDEAQGMLSSANMTEAELVENGDGRQTLITQSDSMTKVVSLKDHKANKSLTSDIVSERSKTWTNGKIERRPAIVDEAVESSVSFSEDMDGSPERSLPWKRAVGAAMILGVAALGSWNLLRSQPEIPLLSKSLLSTQRDNTVSPSGRQELITILETQEVNKEDRSNLLVAPVPVENDAGVASSNKTQNQASVKPKDSEVNAKFAENATSSQGKSKEQELRAHQSTRNSFVIHKVVKGDTLWDLAGQYTDNPFKYPQLAKDNKIKDPNRIYPGEQVRITTKNQK